MKNYKFEIKGKAYEVTVEAVENTRAKLVVNGEEVEVTYPERKVAAPVVSAVQRPVHVAPAAVNTPNATSVSASADTIKSPLPGVILDVCVKEGETVKRGQNLLVLEAMKMENNILAEKDGVVERIIVKVGENVLEGADLITVK